MSSPVVVVVSSTGDPHTHDVVHELRDMHVEVREVNADALPLDGSITVSLGGGRSSWDASLHSDQTLLRSLSNITSVWWRRPRNYYGIPDGWPEQQREFVKAELDQAFAGTWALLDSYWMNRPEDNRRASLKIEQLDRAARFGLETPATTITSDPDVVRAFYAACPGRMVYRVLSEPGLGLTATSEKHPEAAVDQRHTLTTLIGEAELEAIDGVRLSPGLFQEYIEKDVELRVTVIGDDIFVGEIHSQDRESTSVDWRDWANGGLEIRYSRGTLPDDVQERCINFVRSYGLNFSTMDIVKTPDGRYVFLENNPNGNFIWVEKLVPELRMTSALASCLARGANG